MRSPHSTTSTRYLWWSTSVYARQYFFADTQVTEGEGDQKVRIAAGACAIIKHHVKMGNTKAIHRVQDARGRHKCNALNYGIDIKYFFCALARHVVTIKPCVLNGVVSVRRRHRRRFVSGQSTGTCVHNFIHSRSPPHSFCLQHGDVRWYFCFPRTEGA